MEVSATDLFPISTLPSNNSLQADVPDGPRPELTRYAPLESSPEVSFVVAALRLSACADNAKERVEMLDSASLKVP